MAIRKTNVYRIILAPSADPQKAAVPGPLARRGFWYTLSSVHLVRRPRHLLVAKVGHSSITCSSTERSDGPAVRLGDGTRVQLCLALCLAAIESYAAHAEPLPFNADDLLANFDAHPRTNAALRVLAEFGARTPKLKQTILFTHHAHIADMAEPSWASLHRLPVAITLTVVDD